MTSTHATDPASLATTADAGRALGSRGDAWDHAIELGIDVTLIEANLRVSPAERIRIADEHTRVRAAIQSRTVSTELREALDRERLAEKVAALEALVEP